MKADELRKNFLNFFKNKKHTIVPSDSLIPSYDPTLLFTSAGMTQFKNDFLGKGNRDYTRATTAQKCLRTQDLDVVGRTFFHHTFFEMLGNFSFGDYFKREAITWGWEYLTKELKLPEKKLSVSVYLDDDEAYNIWHDEVGLAENKIFRFGAKDNYWPANSPNDPEYRGPCGPCSEIFFDMGEAFGNGDVNEDPSSDSNRFCEIWNLVFPQFNKIGKKPTDMEDLPAPGIDTGMGFARLLAVVNGKVSNFETELFTGIIRKIAELAGINYKFDETETMISIRRIADHAQAICFLVTDGIWPSNEGRGYVLRKVMRRAIRDGKKLNINGIFLPKLIQPVLDVYKNAYPELEEQREIIENVMIAESEQFLKTLTQGEEILENEVKKLKSKRRKILSGKIAFELEATFGFPADLTSLIIQEQGLKINQKELEEQRQKHKQISKGELNGATVFDSTLDLALRKIKKTDFIGYDEYSVVSNNFIILDKAGNQVKILKPETEVYLFSTITPFYAERGGQVGDTGKATFEGLGSVKVVGCVPCEQLYKHILKPDAELDISKFDKIMLRIDVERRKNIVKHHTATHILHYALREVLGKHVHQKGSLVTPDRLRFDFTHLSALSADEIIEIENIANKIVLENYQVVLEIMDIDAAKKKGAMALFGEKYDQKVRVLSVGPSIELCGGTHAKFAGEIGQIRVIQESSIAQGVRRIEAVAGIEAVKKFQDDRNLLHDLCKKLKCSEKDISRGIEKLQEKNRELKEEIKKLKSSGQQNNPEFEKNIFEINGVKLLVEHISDAGMKDLEKISDDFRSQFSPSGVVLIGGTEKLCVLSAFTKDAVNKGLHAGQLVKEVTKILDGKGGGGANFARGSGKNKTKIQESLKKAKEILKNNLN